MGEPEAGLALAVNYGLAVDKLTAKMAAIRTVFDAAQMVSVAHEAS
jgi:hypothetical protein